MYQSRYNSKPTIGIIPLLLLTLLAVAVMLIPVYTSTISVAEKVTATVFPLVCAVLISFIANRQNITKKNFILPAFFVLITMGATGFASGYWDGYLCAFILASAWFLTTTLQKSERCAWSIFTIMFVIAIGSLFSGITVLFIPTLFIGAILFKRLNFINIVAAIFGFGMVYTPLYGIAYLAGFHCDVTAHISSLYDGFHLVGLRIADVIIYSIIGIYTLIAFISFVSRYNSHNIAFRRMLIYNYIFIASAIIVNLLTGARNIAEPLTAILLGTTLPFYAGQGKSNFVKTAFYIFSIALLVVSVVKNFLL